ncbi:hypothetical protein MNBD_BACTEROID06-1394 [hydrothermal vent metagenome]|uniref:Uncharacterized protein n=1 Tax=hydrothermal vent metagenome TaxID=652676 RepID=A0A3B0V432_9ZZZZ
MFEKHMRSYAETSGAITEYEKTGIVPESYSLYEEYYYNKLFGLSNARTQAALTALFKGQWGTGSRNLMPGTLPVMVFGWNNVVSSFEPIGVFGFTSMYNKKIYRKRLFTYWSTGFAVISLSGPLAFANDKMSSGIGG